MRCTDVSEKVFRRIQELFPALEMNRNDAEPTGLTVDIPAQPGLGYAVGLSLQNGDELHFSVEHFRLAWFPCTDPSVVEEYVDAVSGFLAGKYRVMEQFRGRSCTRAELQAPNGGGWRTIGSSVHFGLPWPWRKWNREIVR
jgi:hypothetical protein